MSELRVKIMNLAFDAVDAGRGNDGLTYEDVRQALGLSPGDAGYLRVAADMHALREEGFLAYRFNGGAYYAEDSTKVAGLVKRPTAAGVLQVVFYVHPLAMGLGDDMEDAVMEGSYPENYEYSTGQEILTLEEIKEWFNSTLVMAEDSGDPDLYDQCALMVKNLKPHD